jgi:TonB family protein
VAQALLPALWRQHLNHINPHTRSSNFTQLLPLLGEMHDNRTESALKSRLDREQMKSFRPVTLLLLVGLGFFCPRQVLAQNEPQTNEKGASLDRQPLKLLNSPIAPYPAEALKKQVEGKVELNLIVDAEGHVTDAEVRGGPPELYQAAIASVKQWQFTPPDHAPATTKAEVKYFYDHPCPGPISTVGTVSAVTRLTNSKGTSVDVIDDSDWSLPPYFPKERKAGVTGDLVLSVTIDAKGKPKEIKVVKSLSPHLDKAAIKTVRAWRFKLKDGSPGLLPDTFPLHINFEPECFPEL